MNILKEKTEVATAEPFALIAIDVNGEASEEKCGHIREAGNEHFKNRRFNDAIKKYSEAIGLLVKMEGKECARELAILYQNRAAAYEFLQKISACIEDATKSIATDEHYAKAYFRRAKGYVKQEKFYCAMQDVLQACILERFRNKAYNNMAAEINGKFDSLPLNQHAALAYQELDCVGRECAHCITESLRQLKRSTIIDSLITIIDDNAPNVGYNRVVRGLDKLDYAEIKAGYMEEMAANTTSTPSLNYFRAMIITLHALSGGSNRDGQIRKAGIATLFDLLEKHMIPDAVKTSAQLCIARAVDTTDDTETVDQLLNRLQAKEPNNVGIYLIRSGFFRLSFLNPTKRQYEAMVRGCQLLPHFFLLHFHRVQAKLRINSGPLAVLVMLADVEKLAKQFPNEIEVPMFLGRMHGELKNTEAAKRWTRAAASVSSPDDLHMLYINKGILKPMHPSSTNWFKKAINLNPMATAAYRRLFTYYVNRSREYGKALEVINRGLLLCNEESDLVEMFVERKELLDKIVKQNFWDNL